MFKPHVGSGHICTASGLMGCLRLCSGEGRVVQSQVSVRAAAWCTLGKRCAPRFRSGQMLEGVLGSIRAKPELRVCTQGSDAAQGCWLGREGVSLAPGGLTARCMVQLEWIWERQSLMRLKRYQVEELRCGRGGRLGFVGEEGRQLQFSLQDAAAVVLGRAEAGMLSGTKLWVACPGSGRGAAGRGGGCL